MTPSEIDKACDAQRRAWMHARKFADLESEEIMEPIRPSTLRALLEGQRLTEEELEAMEWYLADIGDRHHVANPCGLAEANGVLLARALSRLTGGV